MQFTVRERGMGMGMGMGMGGEEWLEGIAEGRRADAVLCRIPLGHVCNTPGTALVRL